MLLRIIRWLRGYIVFSVSGAFPERFLNLVNTRGIRNWDFVPDKNGYAGRMFLSDYMKIRPTARSASVRLRAERRIGFPFFIKKYRRRKGLLFGAAAAIIILTVMSQFVWDIKVTGAEGLSETELYSVFEECGLKVGMLKSSLDINSVERQVQLKIPEIRWIAVNALNNVAMVEIKQKSERPEMKIETYPCNIIAAEDGVITDITVSAGTCEVKRGSAAAKNSLLVNSVEKIGEDKQKYVHSEAVIMADVKRNRVIKIPKKKNNIILNENYTEKSSVGFLFINLPFGFAPPLKGAEVRNTYTTALRLNGTTLPLNRTICRSYYFENKQVSLNLESAEKILKTRAALYECFCEGESKVKSRSVKFSSTSDSYTLSMDYVFNKNIAKKQKLKIE